MTRDDEKRFLDSTKRVLDDAERRLDSATVARLRAARRTTLANHKHRHTWRAPVAWLPAGAFAAALTVVAIATLMWLSMPPAGLPPTDMEDLELLAAEDSLEFYADLDFYRWLAIDSDAS